MKLLKFLMAVLAAATVSTINSCEKEPENQLPTNIKEDLTFTLTISEVTYNSAQIRVKHDGSESDTWYGFLTDAPKSKKDAALIVEKLAELTANGGLKGLETKVAKRVSFENLKAGTTYRYIAFGLTPEGLPYGNTNSIEFKTEESSFLLSTVEDWTIAYVERNKEKNMETYSVQFNKNNAPRCHVGFIPKWMVEEYEKQEGIKEELETYGGLRLTFGEGEDAGVYLFSVLDYLVFQELFEYWGYYDGDDTYFTNETFNESSVIELPRQASGEYYAVAIGFTDGQPTWTYAVNEVTIEKETPSADYTSWLGNWTITGQNNITYNLTLEENDPNYSFYVYGWECSESIHNKDCEENCSEHNVYTDFSEYELGIPFYFNALNGNLYIKSTLLDAQATDSDVVHYWGLFGFMEYEGQTVSILTQEDLIAEASLPTTDAGSTTLNGLSSTTYNIDASGNTNEVKFTYNSLSYLQYDDKEYKTLPWNQPMKLPASLVKEAASPSATVAKSDESSKRKEYAIKSYRKIKSTDYSRLNKVKPETFKQLQ